jgi:hypothetical protein
VPGRPCEPFRREHLGQVLDSSHRTHSTFCIFCRVAIAGNLTLAMLDKCEKCGRGWTTAKSKRECIYCGHRMLPLATRLMDRFLQFLVINLLVWAAIGFSGTGAMFKAGILTTVTTAVYLLGGVLLARVFYGAGEWLAIGISLFLALGLLDWALR